MTAAADRGALAVAAAALGASVAPMDTAVNIAFPRIVAAFGLDVPAVQWVVVSYVLTYACLLLPAGRLGDRLGHRRVFVVGIIWSAAALALCALATEFSGFVAARIAQGVGAALLLGNAPALVTLSTAPSNRSRVLSVFMMAFALATVVGPLGGGILIEHFGWQAVFWGRIPIALAGLALLAVVPASAPVERSAPTLDDLDTLLVGLALGTVLLALNRGVAVGTADGPTLLLGAVAVMATATAAWRQRLSLAPILDPALFANARFVAANAVHVLGNWALFTVWLLVPFYLVEYHRLPARDAGMLLAVSPMGAVAGSFLAGRLLGRIGPRPVTIVGLTLVLASLGFIAVEFRTLPVGWIALALMVQGIGDGLFQVAAIDVVMGAMPRDRQGVGGGLNMMTRTAGMVTGVTIVAAAYAQGRTAAGDPHDAFSPAGFETGFVAGAAVAAVALFVIIAVQRRARPG